MREIMAVLGGAALLVIGLTVLGGGNLQLGTGSGGPFFSFGFRGPYQR